MTEDDGAAASPLERTFAAVVFDWDGTAVPDRRADAGRVRRLVEELCGHAVEVAVVSGTHLGNVDGQLAARPEGQGGLHLCLNRGAQVYRVGTAGPQLVHERVASPEEDAALDRAAAAVVERLAGRGLHTTVVARFNRRKIDLIPLPRWADPPKARIAALVRAVTERLAVAGLSGLAEVVALARFAAADAGLPDARVTSDAKHVEIGLTDKSDAMRWVLQYLEGRGIAPGLVLVAGDEFGPLGDVPGSDAMLLVPEARRATAITVGAEPGGVPEAVLGLGGGPRAFSRLLAAQCRRHRAGRVPQVDDDPAWTLRRPVDGPTTRRVGETLLTLSDGRLGTRGSLEEDGPGSHPGVLAAGVYTGSDTSQHLLPGPGWTELAVPEEGVAGGPRPGRWLLDLRTGVLAREPDAPGDLRTLRFASLPRPGLVALRAERAAGLRAGPVLTLPAEGVARFGRTDATAWAQVLAQPGGITAVGHQTRRLGRPVRVERVVAYRADPDRVPSVTSVRAALEGVRFDELLAEHRAAWAARWADAAVSLRGAADDELAVRFALFHLLAVAAPDDELAVGARGLSGPGYAGHVFWDTDVFVLPALVAVAPRAAHAVLQYRVARLDAARARARAEGRAGARFPWESARDGFEVTPRRLELAGRSVDVRTGDAEVHVVADVAWAAWHYAQWTGDDEFLAGPGRDLVAETARYWAARCTRDASGRAHLEGVIGPDEYHGPVDDDAYTNVMARWNLRRGAELLDQTGDHAEAASWRDLADALVDGYDPVTGRYEQFTGYARLEPVRAADLAEPPFAADLLLGQERVASTQLIKQPDVLMLHHLVPDETAPGSLVPNLDHYGPRTTHGSSLSPAIHAALLARAGRPDEALEWFRLAARLDLDDLTGMTAGGLHLATMGGVWQALATGFLGLRAAGPALTVDPVLPSGWEEVDVRLRFRGRRLRVRADHDATRVDADGEVTVATADGATSGGCSLRLARGPDGWRLRR